MITGLFLSCLPSADLVPAGQREHRSGQETVSRPEAQSIAGATGSGNDKNISAIGTHGMHYNACMLTLGSCWQHQSEHPSELIAHAYGMLHVLVYVVLHHE